MVERIAQKTQKRLSLSALKRLAKKAGLRWKRVRQSLKWARDPAAFERGKRPLEALQKQEDPGHIDLYYVDEAGFSLDPTIPSAWPAARDLIEVPAHPSGRVNVFGFMNRQHDLPPYLFDQSLHTGVVIGCFDDFCHTLTKKTVVVRDHASVHRNDAFEECRPHWKKQGLIVKYLPAYSPELNRIESRWRRIKYSWLPFSAYESLSALIEALETILCEVGSEYQITFA